MTEWIARTDRDDREGRLRSVEKRGARRESAAVVRDPQHEDAHGLSALQHPRFAEPAEISRDERRYTTPVEPQDEGIIIRTGVGEPVGIQHGDERIADPDALASAQHTAWRAGLQHGRQHVPAARVPSPAFPELAHVKVTEDRGEAARVVRVRVRERHHIQASDGPVPEERRQHAFADVESTRSTRTSVDE
jgi:hypothetical protein